MRAAETGRQLTGRLRHRDPALQKLSRRVDPRSVFTTGRPAITSHVINILPDMSHLARDTRQALQPSVTQRHLEAEVAHCVGGVMMPPCGVPVVRLAMVPSGCCSGASSHRFTYSSIHGFRV